MSDTYTVRIKTMSGKPKAEETGLSHKDANKLVLEATLNGDRATMELERDKK